MRVLITGAAGNIGAILREGLAGRYDLLRLHDITELEETSDPSQQVASGDLANYENALKVVDGVDVVVHLAGTSKEAPWPELVRNNIETVINIFEAARVSGVRRVVFASSHHVIGFHDRCSVVDTTVAVRPDSRYGVTKSFGESIGRYFHDKFGIGVTCLRIGACRNVPQTRRHLVAWLSPRDCSELFSKCIETATDDFNIFYGVSANSRRRWVDDAEQLVGYEPIDDAEDYAEGLMAAPDVEGRDAANFHGGTYAANGLVATKRMR